MKLIIIFCVFACFLNSVENVGVPPPEYGECDGEINTGPCSGSDFGYAFNKITNQCEVVNRACQDTYTFVLEESCEAVCEDVCYKKVAPGDCTGYAFNKTSKQCETFTNGECNINGNYFETEEACEEACENRCNKKIVSGDCLAYDESFGYNKTTNECVPFNYGGCFGTENRFSTKKECEDTCVMKDAN